MVYKSLRPPHCLWAMGGLERGTGFSTVPRKARSAVFI